jgi:hypothetical protein
VFFFRKCREIGVTFQSPALERSLSRYTCNVQVNGPAPAPKPPPDHPVTAAHRVGSPAFDCLIGPVLTGRGGAKGLCSVFSASRRGCPAVFSPAKYLRTCVTSLAGLRGVSSRVARDGMDRSTGSDGALADLATAEIESKSKSKSKSKIRQSFQGLIQCQCRGEPLRIDRFQTVTAVPPDPHPPGPTIAIFPRPVLDCSPTDYAVLLAQPNIQRSPSNSQR